MEANLHFGEVTVSEGDAKRFAESLTRPTPAGRRALRALGINSDLPPNNEGRESNRTREFCAAYPNNQFQAETKPAAMESCPVCGRVERCRCARGPVVTPVVNQPDARPFLDVDSTLKPPLPLPREISLDVAISAILMAAQGAIVGFRTDGPYQNDRIREDFRGLFATGAFGPCRLRHSEDTILFSHSNGRIMLLTDRKVSLGHFRGMTFARVWDVRE